MVIALDCCCLLVKAGRHCSVAVRDVFVMRLSGTGNLRGIEPLKPAITPGLMVFMKKNVGRQLEEYVGICSYRDDDGMMMG